MRNKLGYSLIVLIIAIAVIIILAGATVASLTTSRETIESSNFIYDLTTVGETVKQYYSQTSTLPTTEDTPITDLPSGMKEQLDILDNENYYNVNLARLDGIVLKNYNREYVVNEQTLKVYSKNPLEYKGQKYYTLTPKLIGSEGEYNEQDEEIRVIGNPLVWSANARLKVVIPRKALEKGGAESENWDNWKFIWGFGPKTAEEMEKMLAEQIEDEERPNYKVREFKYGDTLIAKSNGVYSIYVKEPGTFGKVTLINIVVDKVDDILPECILAGSELKITDNETGINAIYFKTKAEYEENKAEAEELEEEDRTDLDFFLMNGKGSDLILEMPGIISDYNNERLEIEEDRNSEIERYNSYPEEDKAFAKAGHLALLQEYEERFRELAQKYPYVVDPNGTHLAAQLVLYVEDNAGNAVVLGEEKEEIINLDMLTKMYNLGTPDYTGNYISYLSTTPVDEEPEEPEEPIEDEPEEPVEDVNE